MLPLAVVVITGIFLQFRNVFESIQPKILNADLLPNTGLITYEDVFTKNAINPNEIDQVIYQPKKNIIIVRWPSGQEWQLHPQTGAVLKKAVRRTGFLIELHQGSFIGPVGQFGIYVLTSFGLFFLLGSGLILVWPRRTK